MKNNLNLKFSIFFILPVIVSIFFSILNFQFHNNKLFYYNHINPGPLIIFYNSDNLYSYLFFFFLFILSVLLFIYFNTYLLNKLSLKLKKFRIIKHNKVIFIYTLCVLFKLSSILIETCNFRFYNILNLFDIIFYYFFIYGLYNFSKNIYNKIFIFLCLFCCFIQSVLGSVYNLALVYIFIFIFFLVAKKFNYFYLIKLSLILFTSFIFLFLCREFLRDNSLYNLGGKLMCPINQINKIDNLGKNLNNSSYQLNYNLYFYNFLNRYDFVKLTNDYHIIHKKNNFEYLYGSTYKNIIYKYIPRFIYPDKPIENLGFSIPNKYGFMSDSMTHSYPVNIYTESYLNFGILGIFLINFLIIVFLIPFYLVCRIFNINIITLIPLTYYSFNFQGNFSLIFGHAYLSLFLLILVDRYLSIDNK